MTNYLDKDGLKKFWDITKGKYSPLGHTHDDRYLSNVNTSISGQTIKINNTSLTVPTKLSQLTDDVVSGKYLQWTQNEAHYSLSVSTKDTDKDPITVDTGGGILVDGYTGTPFKLWLHDTSNVWYKQTKGGAWAKMDAGKADMLSTARTIWGQSFDGSGNVDGAMTVNGTIHATGAATLDSTLAVEGNATLNSALTVKGATTAEDLTVNGVLTTKGNGVELYHNTPFIDFHYGNSSRDYDVRIWNNVSGGLQINAPTLIDLVGPMKSSGGRLWITKGNTNIYDVTTSMLTSYVKAKHLLTSWFVGNVGIGTDADSAYKLKVNGDAFIQSMRMARWIEADTDQGLVIGNKDNEAYVGFCTDMCGFDADGTDNPTIDDYDANWRITISGMATFNTIVINNQIYVTYNGTRYRLDPVKAMSLGLFVKA